MVMMQRIAVLGATGSIGDSTLAILAAHPQQYQVYALSGYHRLDKLFGWGTPGLPCWCRIQKGPTVSLEMA